MQLQTGQRFQSTVCKTSVVVVRGPEQDVDLRCGGAAMVPADQSAQVRGTPGADYDGGTLIGKRYWDESLGLELVCTSAGAGSLSVGERMLPICPPRPLPSSD